jgi:hypothetical protein
MTERKTSMAESMAKVTCRVENVPEYALAYRYWVVTPDRGKLWFWGAWKRHESAEKNREDNQIIVEFEYATIHENRNPEETA